MITENNIKKLTKAIKEELARQGFWKGEREQICRDLGYMDALGDGFKSKKTEQHFENLMATYGVKE